jgi:hypothetical protein
MSAETQPDPILPNYNPSSWDVPTLSPEERAILDTEYITFPIAQNQNITFPVAPTAPTLANGTNTTQVATTGFVTNAINAFLSTINTWAGTQIFSVGMTSTTINPTTSAGTLNIGNAAVDTNVNIATSASRNVILHLGDGNNNTLTGGVHIGNGATSANNVRILDGAGSTGTIFLGSATSKTELGCPLTLNYATAYAANGSTGTDKLGEIITGTNAAVLTFTAGAPKTISTISSLTVGVWLFSAQVGRGSAGGYLNGCISLTTDSFAAPLCGDTYQTTGSTGPLNSFSFILYVPTTGVPYYFVGQADTGSPFTSVLFNAVRLF